MKNPETVRADGVSENITEYPNLSERPGKNKSTGLIQRDAKAMVHILNSLKSGSLEPFENIYESLKNLHGPEFEKHFRDELSTSGDRNG